MGLTATNQCIGFNAFDLAVADCAADVVPGFQRAFCAIDFGMDDLPLRCDRGSCDCHWTGLAVLFKYWRRAAEPYLDDRFFNVAINGLSVHSFLC